jgi:hypothetical protein
MTNSAPEWLFPIWEIMKNQDIEEAKGSELPWLQSLICSKLMFLHTIFGYDT